MSKTQPSDGKTPSARSRMLNIHMFSDKYPIEGKDVVGLVVINPRDRKAKIDTKIALSSPVVIDISEMSNDAQNLKLLTGLRLSGNFSKTDHKRSKTAKYFHVLSALNKNTLNRKKIIKKKKSSRKNAKYHEKIIRAISNTNLAPSDRATIVGAAPGKVLDNEQVKNALELIAASATDLFGSVEEAVKYIDREDFASSGYSARELLAVGRTMSIIARLDALRFGSQG